MLGKQFGADGKRPSCPQLVDLRWNPLFGRIRAESSENPGSPASDWVPFFGEHLLRLDYSVMASCSPYNTPARSPVAQGLMGPEPLVESEIVFQSPLGLQELA